MFCHTGLSEQLAIVLIDELISVFVAPPLMTMGHPIEKITLATKIWARFLGMQGRILVADILLINLVLVSKSNLFFFREPTFVVDIRS